MALLSPRSDVPPPDGPWRRKAERVEVIQVDHRNVTQIGRSPAPGTGYLPYRYDVHGIVSLGSKVRLPELERFHAPWLGRDYDIEIRVGRVGSGARRRVALFKQANPTAGVRYEEHLGRLGANFSVEMGDKIRVVVSPLLAFSPHVLYTNLVEAMLRFVLVSRGRMLLHSACVELGASGLMLSARTDTGKTGTVLRLLREQGARFLSDDMTILEPSGVAWSFPKPLTISQHTLRAVDPGDMTPREWQVLKVKGRLHSKEGRGIGMWLGELNVPIMSFNSVTQMLVPPPKYAADRLVACESIRTTQVRDLVIIERGAPSLEQLTHERTIDELIMNTDDAYGFPPFRHFAPGLVLDGADYETLRSEERRILSEAMYGVRLWRMGSDSFDWADRIPQLIDSGESAVMPIQLSG